MSVKIDLSPLTKFTAVILGKTGAIKVMLKQWAAIYRGFVQERFDAHSKGGGDWKPLSPTTIAHRRKGKGIGAVATILRDTNTLYGALDPGRLKHGAIEKITEFGVKVGYGGGDKHPKGRATIANIAKWHDTGAGRLPQRKIIVPPNNTTLRLMIKTANKTLRKITNG